MCFSLAGQTAPVYRLVSITKWNTTTGNLSVLHVGALCDM